MAHKTSTSVVPSSTTVLQKLKNNSQALLWSVLVLSGSKGQPKNVKAGHLDQILNLCLNVCSPLICYGHLLTNTTSGSRRPWGPEPPCPCPQDFFKIMQFSGNCQGNPLILSKFCAQASPGGQSSAGPP